MAVTRARLGSRGQLTLPRPVREALAVKPGDYVTFAKAAGGVLIIPVERHNGIEAEALLKELTRAIGARLEAQGIVEEEQFDPIIEEAKRQTFEHFYGRSPS